MEKHKKINVVLFTLSILTLGIGFYYSDPVARGLCPDIYGQCFDVIVGRSGPMLFVSISVAVVLIILFLTRSHVFYSWLKFSAPALLLGIIWIASTPVNFIGGELGLGPSPFAERESVTWIVSVPFLLISVAIIVWKTIKLQRVDKIRTNEH